MNTYDSYEDVIVRAANPMIGILNSARKDDPIPTIWGHLPWSAASCIPEGAPGFEMIDDIVKLLTRSERDGQALILKDGTVPDADQWRIVRKATSGIDAGKVTEVEVGGVLMKEGQFKIVKGVMKRNAVIDACVDYTRAVKLVLAGMERSQQPVHSIPDLGRLLQSPAGQQMVERRISLVDQARGLRNTVVIDAAEKYEIQSANMTAAEAAIEAAKARVAAVSGIPSRIIFGDAQGGSLSSGTSDTRQWNGAISRYQRSRVAPVVEFVTGKQTRFVSPESESPADRGQRLDRIASALDRLLSHGVISNQGARQMLAAEGFDIGDDHEQ